MEWWKEDGEMIQSREETKMKKRQLYKNQKKSDKDCMVVSLL